MPSDVRQNVCDFHKPEVILTNFFAEPTVLLVPITSRDYLMLFNRIAFSNTF
jgi:hypothetical protein